MNVIVYSENAWEGWGTIRTESEVTATDSKTLFIGDNKLQLVEDVGCIYNEETKVISFINLDFVKWSSHEIVAALSKEESEYTLLMSTLTK